MDPFLSRENLEHVYHTSLSHIPGDDVMRKAEQLSITTPIKPTVHARVRVETLNRRLIQSLTTPELPTPLPIRVRERSDMDSSLVIAPPTKSDSFRNDEKIVVVNMYDVQQRTSVGVSYDMRIHLGYPFSNDGPKGPVPPQEGAPTTNDLPMTTENTVNFSLQEVIHDCVSITPVALFVPRADVAANDNAFLVLKTDVASSNRMMSTKGTLDGANVLMAPASSPADVVTNYIRFTNITNTTLSSKDPMRRLTSLRIQVVTPSGALFQTSNIGTVDSWSRELFPHLVLRVRTRVPN